MQAFQKLLDRALGTKRRYQRVFSGPDGEWVFNDIMLRCGMGMDPHQRGDSHDTEYMVGRQSVARAILDVVNMSEADVHRRILEQQAAAAAQQEDENYD